MESHGGAAGAEHCGSLARWDRKTIGERTRNALTHQKAKMEFVGNCLYEFRRSADRNTVKPGPREQPVRKTTRRLRDQGPVAETDCGVPEQRAALHVERAALAAQLRGQKSEDFVKEKHDIQRPCSSDCV